MKTYTKPEVDVMVLKSSDIITVSGLRTSADKGLTQTSFKSFNATDINFN